MSPPERSSAAKTAGSSSWTIPEWWADVLACQKCEGIVFADGLIVRCGHCGEVGSWRDGIFVTQPERSDAAIAWYSAMGGTHLHDRAEVPFTTSSLDSCVYRSYLDQLRQAIPAKALIADIGAGDGRNTQPWLEWGYERVIAVDAVRVSLERLRDRIAQQKPDLAGNLLLVQSDIRRLPLRRASVGLALAIEALYYLNDDYEVGLAETRRIVTPGGTIMLSERAWEGAFISTLLERGLGEMLTLRRARDAHDGFGGQIVRSRTFTEEELLEVVGRAGLEIHRRAGISVLSIVLGYLRHKEQLAEDASEHFADTCETLRELGERGQMRRAHVIVAGVPDR